MTKIADAFANGKAFIPFLTCGDPDLETTEKLIGPNRYEPRAIRTYFKIIILFTVHLLKIF